MSMSKSKKAPIFIGVAWPYVNGDLHVGHVAGYLLPADITARAYRLMGHEVLMASGSDSHGTPITVEADKRGVTPQEIVDIYHPKNLKLFESLGLTFDNYTTTITELHKDITQKILLSFWEKDLIEIKTQKQYYSPSLSRFLPDRYVEGKCPHCGFEGARSDQCDNCGNLLDQNLINPYAKLDNNPVELKDTEHLFIKWGEIQNEIEEYVGAKSDKWRQWVKKETQNWLDRGLEPRAVSRDLDWGVEIPDEIAKKLPNSENKRLYVWFDAVIGYYSASCEWANGDEKKLNNFWRNGNCLHYYFMGKDNLVFHTIFWPGQLMTFDESLNLPDFPAINQYLNLEGKKFSKSRGVVVDTAQFIEKFNSDALRFYLTTIMPETADTSFSMEDFYNKNNDLLVGHIGNYIHRTLSLYNGEEINGEINNDVITTILQARTSIIDHIRKSEFKKYWEELDKLASFANQYFDDKKPWVSKKEDKGKFLSDGVNLIILAHALASLIEPITPFAAEKYRENTTLQSNELWQKGDNKEFYNALIDQISLQNKPEALFEKYEAEK